MGLPDQSLQEHLQEGVEDVLTELYLQGGRGGRERKREGGRAGRGRGEGGGGRGGRRGREGKGGGVREVRREG